MNDYDSWLGKLSTGGDVYYSYNTSSTGLPNWNYKPTKTNTTSNDNLTVICSPGEELVYKGEKYRIDRVERSMESNYASGEITIHGYRVGRYLDGFSGTFIIDNPSFINDFKRAFNPYAIKKVIVNTKKNATTVLWADGTHTVVKRSEGDEPADIWSVVSYALAEKVYGSNSAFKREIKGKVERMKE